MRRTFRTGSHTSGGGARGAADPGPVAGKVYTVNSTELRAIGLELPVGGVGCCGAPQRSA